MSKGANIQEGLSPRYH